MGARSEHWHSDPIHGLFSGCVPEDSARWTTSNRNVFCVRNGVCNSPVSSGIMQRVMDASNGSISSNDFAKPYVRARGGACPPLPAPPMRAAAPLLHSRPVLTCFLVLPVCFRAALA